MFPSFNKKQNTFYLSLKFDFFFFLLVRREWHKNPCDSWRAAKSRVSLNTDADVLLVTGPHLETNCQHQNLG